MSTRHKCARWAVGLAAMVLAGTGASALSDQYETAPEQDPSVVLGPAALGPGYAVIGPVRSDGFLRIYDLQTSSGMERVEGDGSLGLRLAEIRALVALDALKSQTSFVDGLKQAARKPVDFVESTVTDPVGTARNTVSGVGRMFGRLTRGVEAAVTGQAGSPAELAKSITGQARARRELALELGVDPYTRDAALSAKLDETASVTTIGSWTVSAITSLVPGGIIVNATRAADDFRTLIVDSTLQELDARTAETFRKAGVSEPVISRLQQNPYFTPTERTVLAYQLQALGAIEGRDLIAAKAAEADTRDIAYFQLRRAVLLDAYHRSVSPIGKVVAISGIPVALRRDGLAAVVLPLDMIAWTETTARTFATIHEGLRSLPFPPTGADLLITGDITPAAAERIAAFGWQVTANYPMPSGPVH